MNRAFIALLFQYFQLLGDIDLMLLMSQSPVINVRMYPKCQFVVRFSR